MLGLAKGRYSARLAREDRDLEAAQRLRHLAFRGSEGIDSDVYDAVSDHVIVEDVSNGTIVCCFRMMPF
ncbi:MAG: GNAT family N-acyltransferase, partial [Pseudomonadota bacterium]|nr:GNAT family N-acyltransferase [Pseudomonadota bacterium]